MELLKRPAWWIPALLFVLHQVVQYGFNVSVPLVDSYLDPLLCAPVLLGLLSVERGYLFGRRRLDVATMIGFVLATTLFFEVLFPRWETRFVSDWWDILAYAVGAMYYAVVLNPDSLESSDEKLTR